MGVRTAGVGGGKIMNSLNSAVALPPHFLPNPPYSSPYFLLNPSYSPSLYSSPPITTSTVVGPTSIFFLSAPATPGAGGTGGGAVGGDSSGYQNKKGKGNKFWWIRAWNFYEEKIVNPMDYFNRVGTASALAFGFGASVYGFFFMEEDIKKLAVTFLKNVSNFVVEGEEDVSISFAEIAAISTQMKTMMEQMKQMAEKMKEGEGK